MNASTPISRCKACCLLALLFTTAAIAEETVPADLRPFVELADKCEKYDQASRAWDVTFEEDLTKPASCEVAGGGLETLRAEKEKDKPVLVLDAEKLDRATVTFGPAVAGDFRAMVEVKITSEHTSDLDLYWGDSPQGPGFDFGTQDNSRNVLKIGEAHNAGAGGQPNGGGGGAGGIIAPGNLKIRIQAGGGGGGGGLFGPGGVGLGAVELPHDNLILRRGWHRVGIEVIGDSIGAMLDGKCLGRSKLAPGFDRQKPRRLALTTVKSTVVIRMMRIEQFRSDPQRAELKKTWTHLFSEQATRKDVEEKIADLIVRLDNQEPAIRDGAEKLLKRMGHLAIAPAEQATHDDGETPEVRQRAGTVLEKLKSASRAPDPPAGEFVNGGGGGGGGNPGGVEVQIEIQGGR